MKSKIDFGLIDKEFKKRIAKFMKSRNNNMRIDDEKLGKIFTWS